MSHNAIGLLKANGEIEEYANTSGGGGSSDGIDWITKEQWDQMTPEQQTDPTKTYGVQGLGGGGGVDTSMIAGTEGTNTSTHAYAIGEYFINSLGLLCKATKAIAIGDTISVGSGTNDNAVATTVGGELSELNSKIPSVNIYEKQISQSPTTLSDLSFDIEVPAMTRCVFDIVISYTDSAPVECGLYLKAPSSAWSKVAHSDSGYCSGVFTNDSNSVIHLKIFGRWAGSTNEFVKKYYEIIPLT